MSNNRQKPGHGTLAPNRDLQHAGARQRVGQRQRERNVQSFMDRMQQVAARRALQK